MVTKISAMVMVATIGMGCINAQQPDYAQWVNPLIGTDNMGHTFPGATVPFGSIQLSPDTDTVPYSLDGKSYNPEVYR